MSAIAYCVKSRKQLLAEVASAPASVTRGRTATATTPDCPADNRLIAGGFSAPATLRIFDGAFDGLNTWTASAAPIRAPVKSPPSVIASKSPRPSPWRCGAVGVRCGSWPIAGRCAGLTLRWPSWPVAARDRLCCAQPTRAPPPPRARARAAAKTVIATKTFTSTTPDQTNQRYEVYCPKGSRPLGGGISATPPVQANGQGRMPDVVRAPRPAGGLAHHRGPARKASTYTGHAPGLLPQTSRATSIRARRNCVPRGPGQTVTIDAQCPGKKKLISGGYLTTAVLSPPSAGGPYGKGVGVHESRAVGQRVARSPPWAFPAVARAAIST